MYLFLRNRTAAHDRQLEATAFAVDIAAKATRIVGHEISVWQTLYGAPATVLGWTMTLDSHQEMGVAREKLLADNDYVETITAAAHLFEGPTEDVLAQVVGTAGDGGHRGDYASIVSAQCALGRISDAMAFGVEMMDHVAGVTGRDGLFTRSMYGPWAQIAWFSLASSLEEVDAAEAALSADPEYLTKVDSSAGLFTPGSGHGRLTQRLA